MNIKQKPCKHCGVVYHFSFQCPTRAKPLKQRKPIKKVGKYGAQWLRTRQKWLKINNSETYICHYCGVLIPRKEVTLDHYKPRGSHPELRYELSNLVPCCWSCNGKKGSIDGDIFIKRHKEG